MKTKLFFGIIILTALSSFSQLKKKVLFIGNSYTYFNNLPQLVADIALSKSDTVVYDQSTPGGFTFQSHCLSAVTWSKIKLQKWDAVILQAQSQEPSLDPTQVKSQTYPYAKQLIDSIRINNPCTEVLFYMTWGRKNGDVSNCGVYPPVCTYNGMQARLRESYMLFKDSFMTSVSPVGVAWKTYRINYPTIDLYDPDESHPNLWGSYLAASTIYSSLFKKTTVGSAYNPGLPGVDLNSIQSITSQTVLDSTLLWNLGSQLPKANFTYSNTSPQAFQFTSTASNATSFLWSFGSLISNPSYTFSTSGTFTVQLKATNGCSSDSIVKTIFVAGIKELSGLENADIYVAEGKLYYKNKFEKDDIISIYSIEGKKLVEITDFKQPYDLSKLSVGVYNVLIKQNGFFKGVKIVNTH